MTGTTIKIFLTEAATYALKSTSDVAAYLAQLYFFHIAGTSWMTHDHPRVVALNMARRCAEPAE